MLLLLGFAFLAGLITILSPCILPVLPIVLAGSATGGRRRPLGIITGFIISFTFFTLFAFTVISFLGLSPDTLRYSAITILGLFGLTLVVPQASDLAKKYFSKLANVNTNRSSLTANHSGFLGGVIVGLSLGLIWTPCVGPIISSVITLAATSSVTWQAVALTFAYTLGTAIPMFAIMIGGRALLNRIPWLLGNTEKLQKIFGVLMILIALAMTFGFDRKFQTYILDTFPSYGSGLTKIEDNEAVKQQLEGMDSQPAAQSPSPTTPALDLTPYPAAPNPQFTGATKWLNSEPLTLEKLKGKVVLVDFWTYTCINCIRTLPYLTSWDAKYKDQGLVIIGVHAPEFSFEKEEKNVLAAMKQYGIKYPVVQDNDFGIWKSYKNRYWPAKYLIDAQGRFRDTHFGEGAYEETEEKIQELLKEAGAPNVNTPLTKGGQGGSSSDITPETYLGLSRMERLVSNIQLTGTVTDFGSNLYERRPGIKVNQWALGGKWSFTDEYAQPRSGSELQFNVKAKDIFLVARMKREGSSSKIRLSNGTGFACGGKDVKSDESGAYIEVSEDRLYHLVHLEEGTSVGKVTCPKGIIPEITNADGSSGLNLRFDDENVELYAFTFG